MQNRFNTLSSAYTVLALGAYTNAVFDRSGAVRLEIADEAGRLLAEAATFARAKPANDVDTLQISGSGGNDVYYVLSQTGFDRTPPSDALAEGLEIFREYLDDDGAHAMGRHGAIGVLLPGAFYFLQRRPNRRSI